MSREQAATVLLDKRGDRVVARCSRCALQIVIGEEAWRGYGPVFTATVHVAAHLVTVHGVQLEGAGWDSPGGQRLRRAVVERIAADAGGAP